MERYVCGAGAFLVRSLTGEPTARAAMDRALREAADAFTTQGSPTGCLIQTALLGLAVENEQPARLVADLRRLARGAIATRLQRGVEAGELPAGTNTAALAGYFAAMIQGMAVQARDGATRVELDAMIDIAIKAFPGAGEGEPRG